MRIPTPSARLVVAGALVGLVFVSPALSSREPVRPADLGTLRPSAAAKLRPSRPAPRVAETGLPCAKVRRSLWVEGDGWIVRRVSVCR